MKKEAIAYNQLWPIIIAVYNDLNKSIAWMHIYIRGITQDAHT